MLESIESYYRALYAPYKNGTPIFSNTSDDGDGRQL